MGFHCGLKTNLPAVTVFLIRWGNLATRLAGRPEGLPQRLHLLPVDRVPVNVPERVRPDVLERVLGHGDGLSSMGAGGALPKHTQPGETCYWEPPLGPSGAAGNRWRRSPRSGLSF